MQGRSVLTRTRPTGFLKNAVKRLLSCCRAKVATRGRVVFPAVVILVALLGVPRVTWTQVTQRPLTDFLRAQGTTSTIYPPVPDYLLWTDPENGTDGSVDYAGLANRYLIANGFSLLNTQFDGSVLERPLSDGTAEVTVILHTTNALAFAVADLNIYVPLFGYLATELLVNRTATPAIGDSHLKVVFKNTAPGALLPDLSCLLDALPCPANFELLFISFYATPTGPLRSTFGVPENTPGRASIVQTGLFSLPPLPANSRAAGGFPVARVDLKVVGKQQ